MRASKAWVFPINFRAYYSPPTFVPRVAQSTSNERSVFPRSVKAEGFAIRTNEIKRIASRPSKGPLLQGASEIRRFIYLHEFLFDKHKSKLGDISPQSAGVWLAEKRLPAIRESPKAQTLGFQERFDFLAFAVLAFVAVC
jgi:hypothetical protein